LFACKNSKQKTTASPVVAMTGLDSAIYKSLVDSPQNWTITDARNLGQVLQRLNFDTIPNVGRRNLLYLIPNGTLYETVQHTYIPVHLVIERINTYRELTQKRSDSIKQSHIDYLIKSL
jgi:hypothetical protein